MPAATTKAGLIAVTDREWAKLDTILSGIATDLTARTFEDGYTIRDIVSHRTHWIGLFFQWLEEGAEAQMPDHGVKWNELKPYNEGLRERYRDVPWDEALARFRAAHMRLRDWMERADEATLYGGPMPGGTGWTTGRYAEAAGPSHYRSAAKVIRGYLKTV